MDLISYLATWLLGKHYDRGLGNVLEFT